MSSTRRLLAALLSRFWLPAVLVALWWSLSAGSQSVYFPPLSTILHTFQQDWLFRLVPTNVAPSVRNFALGFALATVSGVLVGTAIASFRWLRLAVWPYVHFIRSIPPAALLPFGLTVLGLGASLKVGIIAIGAVWPTLLNTVDGIHGSEPLLTDFARVYHLSRWQRLRYVVLPAASPQIFAGIRTTLQISIILIVVSEMIASTEGIGYYVLQSQQSFAVAQTWAGTILLGLLGYLGNLAFNAVESRALAWQQQSRRGSADVG